MYIKIINKEKINIKEINNKIIRAKALLLNSNNELLLGYLYNTFQFPGGHVKDYETVSEGLIREIKEETGIILEDKEYTPFYQIQYYNRNYPKKGLNTINEINYFLFNTDEKTNLYNTNYDKYEIMGNYTLKYVKIDELEEVLNDYLFLREKNNILYNEMITVTNYYKSKKKLGLKL